MVRLNMPSRRALAIVGLVLLAIMLLVPIASALDSRGGEVVIIGSDEVIDDDLYVVANEFRLDGTVKGDLFVAGGMIVINGAVEGDLVAAGQSVTVNGTVQDDTRIAGWALAVSGNVGDDLLAAGFSLETRPESSVGGELLTAGYQARVAGSVAGDASANGNAVLIDGRIGGNLAVNVDGAQQGLRMPTGFPFAPSMPPVPSVPSGLTITENASISGNLDYTAAAPVSIPSGVVAGQTSFTQYVAPEGKERPEVVLVRRLFGWFWHQVQRLITFLLIGAAMMWLVPAWTRATAHIVRQRPLPSLGWGALALAAFVAAMILTAIVTLVVFVVVWILALRDLAGLLAGGGVLGMSIAAYAFNLVWRYVGRIIVGVLLGQLVLGLFRSRTVEHRWWPMLLGVFLYVVITSIPVLGWLLGFVAALLGLGAIWIWGRDWWRSRRAPAQAATVGPVEAPSGGTGAVVEAKAPGEPPEGADEVPPAGGSG